jgi:hypothetical protein
MVAQVSMLPFGSTLKSGPGRERPFYKVHDASFRDRFDRHIDRLTIAKSEREHLWLEAQDGALLVRSRGGRH